MIVEVVAVGTELLLGQIVNSNAAEVAKRLAGEGFDTHHQVVVGDNPGRLLAVLRTAVDRADAVVITGGIGPTQDDLTREALCELTGRDMTRDESHAEWIAQRVSAQGRQPASNVFRMADLPEGATALPNRTGVALGVGVEHRGVWLFALPGVPAEMIPMLEEQVLPRLREAAGEPEALVSRVLRCWGMGESSIAERVDDLSQSANPSLAFLIKDMEVLIRLTAKAATQRHALELITPIEDEIRRRLGSVVFGVDEVTVETLVVRRLESAGWTVATVEQATLGSIGARLADADTSAKVFAGTLVPGLDEPGAPKADVRLVVGRIGPDRADGPRTTRPVEMSVKTPDVVVERVFDLGGDDERLRSFATIAGLHLLRTAIEEDI